MLKNKKLYVKFFCASLLCLLVWDAPKLTIIDSILKKQPLAFSYNQISGEMGEITLHNVTPNRFPAITLPRVTLKPSYISLFTGKFLADISADISNGSISGFVNQSIFSNEISLDIQFTDISILTEKELLEKTIFKSYLDATKANFTGNLTGKFLSSYWPDKQNNMQLTFTFSDTELALKNLGSLEAGEINGTLSMQDGAMFADIHTLDDNKGFSFELDGRTALAPRISDSGIAGELKLSFLGGNEAHKIIKGSIGKPRLIPVQ